MGRVVLHTSLTELDHHDTGGWHPERPSRLPAVDRATAQPRLAEALRWFEPRQAEMDELARAHDLAHLERVRDFAERGGGAVDADTQVSAGSWDTARWAAGAGLAAIDALDAGDGEAAFINIRPPGHHATATQAMGFCLVNNIAVAAATLAERGERVAIFDWDVHHGNGTQDIFFDDHRVLFASTHEHPQYPGTGRAAEIGTSEARGLTVNVPLPTGTSGRLALQAFDQIIGPEIDEFDPTWILVSAGYDAHRADPLAGLEWAGGDYWRLTELVTELAPRDGRIIVFLEGGYDLDALTTSATATIAALADLPYDDEPISNLDHGMSAVTTAHELRRRSLEGG